MHAGQLFATVFGIIFLAELPDKTALAALVLATRHRALPVFLGASAALTVQSLVAVAAGSLLARLPPRIVHIGSGVLFLGCALWMWLRETEDSKGGEEADAPASFWRAFSAVFMIIFIAEWGDLTQIGTAALQAKYHAWSVVLSASVLALWMVAGVAVFVGNRAGKLLDPTVTKKVAAVVFAVIGALLVGGVV